MNWAISIDETLTPRIGRLHTVQGFTISNELPHRSNYRARSEHLRYSGKVADDGAAAPPLPARAKVYCNQ
jgi:hypothetical protein